MQKICVNRATDALLVTDVQETFMPGGGLSVVEGNLVVPVIRDVMRYFPQPRRYASLDQHPYGHSCLLSSYEGVAPTNGLLTYDHVCNWNEKNHQLAHHANFSVHELQEYLAVVEAQMLWPDHGIIGSKESTLHPAFVPQEFRFIMCKGMNPVVDSYSSIKDALGRSTGLGVKMKRAGIKRVFTLGLAFDFCVGFGACDAADEGFEVYLIKDGTRSVNFGTSVSDMEAQLEEHGVEVIESAQLAVKE